MSIKVSNVTKMYGTQKALNSVSFEVGQNEIVGFLGPNGAGKSTMMKILTCYIPPSSGTASVNGFTIQDQSIDVRKQIGYLPENNPLYLDMYVKEFLQFVAGIYKLNNRDARVKDMIHLTGLQQEQSKKIGALSKGYRQRVGLAQAMIHDPNVLILDEPTTGLDPNQLEEIRDLIRSLGKHKTVMLSTHIMQEVEAICDRVIIINRGEIVANSDTKSLKQSVSQQTVVVEFDKVIDKSSLEKIGEIDQMLQLSEKSWRLVSTAKTDLRELLFDFAVANNVRVLSLNNNEQNMEDVFKKYTN